jgi:hypothetical protein
LLTGDRAEQIQMSHSCPAQVGFMGAKGRDHIVSIHRHLLQRRGFVQFSESGRNRPVSLKPDAALMACIMLPDPVRSAGAQHQHPSRGRARQAHRPSSGLSPRSSGDFALFMHGQRSLADRQSRARIASWAGAWLYAAGPRP